MPDQTARDAVAAAITEAQVRNRDGASFAALQVLAALGIPPDTTTDEVRDALLLLHAHGRPAP